MYFSWISCSVYIELDFFFKQTHTYKVLQYYNVHHDKLMPKNKTYRKDRYTISNGTTLVNFRT